VGFSCMLLRLAQIVFFLLQSFAERSILRLKQASLKDLRPEDKQRVANLIKELARFVEISLAR